MDLKDIIKNIDKYINKEIIIKGWIKNHRSQKDYGFIDFNDGTTFKALQVVYDKDTFDFENVSKYHNGSSIEVHGIIVASTGKGQDYELKASKVILLGDCPIDYPMQPKRHTVEFLRENAYLRPRVSYFNAVFKIRNAASFAIHEYFQNNNFVYFSAPLITTSDCEGAGEMFQVTTLPLDKLRGEVDYSKDFFGKKSSLTVSGQLEAETFATAYKKTYTFGPTFRAENSNTKTHMNEFWMVEPEVAFNDLNDNMDLIEDMLKYVVKSVLNRCKDELEFCDKFLENGLINKLEKLINSKFTRIDHKDVIKILKETKVEWEFTPEYGKDIAKEHEKYITEYFDGPVFIKNWPKDIKAFYMKLNDDNETVAAVDLEVPGAGELIGGSQREESYEKLLLRMKQMNVSEKELWWYLNLRKYGTCVHSGFGMGFERLIMYLTGVANIRDAIPYPRTPNNCEY